MTPLVISLTAALAFTAGYVLAVYERGRQRCAMCERYRVALAGARSSLEESSRLLQLRIEREDGVSS